MVAVDDVAGNAGRGTIGSDRLGMLGRATGITRARSTRSLARICIGPLGVIGFTGIR